MRAPRLRFPSPVRLACLATLGFCLAALVLAGSAALTLSHSLSPESFAAHVGTNFGRNLSVDSVALELRPAPRIRVEGLVIEGLGTAAAAEIELRLRPLLDGQLVVRSVRFEDLRATLRRRPDGSFEPLYAARAGAGPTRLQALPRFEAERGEIRIVKGDDVSAVVGLRTLTLGRFDADDSAPLVLSGQIGGGDRSWTLQPLHLRGRLVRQSERMAFLDGYLRANEAHVRWWHGRNVQGRFQYQDGRIDVESLDVAGYGGGWHASGPIHLRGGTRLDLDVALADVDVAAILTAARPEETFRDLGTLRTRWDLQVPWSHGPRFERGLGTGHLEVLGGALPSQSFSRVVRQSLGLSPRPLSTSVESLVAPIALREGRLHSGEARLLTQDYDLTVAGSLGLDASLELTGSLDLGNLPAFPVTIRGKLPHPDVETHLSQLPKDGLGAVVGAVKRTGSTIARGTASAGGWLRDAIAGKEAEASPPPREESELPR